MRVANIYTNLPKIIQVLYTEDTDRSYCPHCGAEGRYIKWFIVESGEKLGAMAGCFQKFPFSKFAKLQARLMKKQDDYTKRGWNLPSWDSEKLETIRDFQEGTCTEIEALDRIREMDDKAYRFRQSMKGSRPRY